MVVDVGHVVKSDTKEMTTMISTGSRASRRVLMVAAILLAALGYAGAQTTTDYPIPTGQICPGGNYNPTVPLSEQGLTTPEHCNYHPTGIDSTNGYGRFQTGDPYTQLVFTGQLGYYCTNFQTGQSTSVWSIADQPALGPTAKKYTLDCAATSNNNVPATIHAEIYIYSYVQQVKLCFRSCSIGYKVNWATLDNSFVSLTQ